MWNANGGAPASLGFDPRGKLDFSQVGMMGHSRGGEGVRAAYNLYRDNGSPWPTRILAPVTFRGVFEIAPVDGQSDRVLDADGTAWAVLLPMCDGDVSDLQGVLPFDRMVTRALGANAPTERPPNTAISVWGANHNFYNTEWQTSDSNGCRNHTALWSGTEIGSAKQRQTALATLMAFFRTHVGNTQEDFGRNLDGAFQLPASASTITRVDRTFVKSATDESTLSLERFNRTAPQGSLGLTHVTSQVTLAYENRFPHDLSLRVGKIGWQNASNDTFLQFRLANGPPGINLSLMESLDFDLSRPEDPRNMANVPTDFEVRIADTMGRISSPLILRDFFNLIGPAGNSEGQLPVVTSVRLPLSRFTGVDLSKIAMVQLTFNRTAQGAIYLANLRASDNQTPTLYTTPLLPISLLPSQTSGMMLAAPVSTNELKRSRLVGMKAIGSETGVPMTEIEVFRESGFPITNALPSIKVGEQEFYSGRYGPNGDTRRMIFRIPSAAATLIRSNQPATVRFGSDSNKAISISLTPE